MDKNSETTIQARGCIQLGDLIFFAFGSFIMFGKTADVLSKFAPSDWFGFSSGDYGIAAALLIEGFLVWRKVKMWLVPPKNFAEWATDLVTTAVPFVLSLAAQAIDGYVTTGLINSMSQEQKTAITTIVSLLIGIPLVLDIGKTAIENAPVGIFDSLKTKEGGLSLPFLDNLFRPRKQKENSVFSKTIEQPLAKPVLEPPNGQDKETVNPTIGKRS